MAFAAVKVALIFKIAFCFRLGATFLFLVFCACEIFSRDKLYGT
jgi:hypothetical protein